MAEKLRHGLPSRCYRTPPGASTCLTASPAGYLRVGAIAQVRRDDYAPQGAFDATGLSRSVTGAA